MVRLSVLRDHPNRLMLTAIGFVCASLSAIALLLHAAGWLPMYFLVDTLGAPSLALLLLLGVLSKRVDDRLFFGRLWTGTWGGLIATFAYDLIRLAIWQGGLISFDPFLSHPIFGAIITGLPVDDPTAIAVGWAYHFWNGIGFGIMYTLIAGRAHWGYAVAWAVFLEIGWLVALPPALSFALNGQLIVVSIIGHIAYGVTLGAIAQRYLALTEE